MDGTRFVGDTWYNFHGFQEGFEGRLDGTYFSVRGGTGSFETTSTYAVSNGGTYVASTVSSSFSGAVRAFRNSESLGILPGAASNGQSQAFGISADGSVVVGTSDSANGLRVFRWTAATGMVDIGTVPGATNWSLVGVSADGSVIVGNVTGSPTMNGFRWTAETGITGLGELPGGGLPHVYGMTSDARVIYGGTSAGNFRWTLSGGIALWPIGVGFASDDEQVVLSNLGLQTPLTGPTQLVPYLQSLGVTFTPEDMPSDLYITGMSADGRVLVGTAFRGGAQRAWIATIPRCGQADFDCDGDTGTDADIAAFFSCLSGTCPAQPCRNNADFNGDGDVGTDADIESFFRVLAGAAC